MKENNIRNNLKKGVLWNAVLAFGKQGLNFIATISLARLLTPNDYGLIGMMAIFIAVSETIIDAGLGGALIKKKDAQKIDYSTLSTYNFAVSCLLYCAIFFIAPLTAEFYETPALTNLLRIYALTLLIDALAIVPKVTLLRNFKFKTLSLITVSSGFIGLSVAIVMALMGCGVYSLIAQYLVSSLVSVILTTIHTKYIFTFGFSYSSFKEMFVFGVNTSLANVIRNFSENLFTNAIAKVAPLTTTGYYNQSYKIQDVLSSILKRIVEGGLFPVLSREEDKDIVRISFKVSYFTYAFLSFCYFLLIINAHYIILILLGEKWIDMEQYLKLLLLVGLMQNFTALSRNLLKSLAKTFDILLVESVNLLFVFIALLILPLNVPHLLGLVLLYSLVRYMGYVIVISLKEHIISIGEYLRRIIRSVYIPVFSVLAAYAVNMLCSNIFILNGSYILVFILLCSVLKPQFYTEMRKMAISKLNHKR